MVLSYGGGIILYALVSIHSEEIRESPKNIEYRASEMDQWAKMLAMEPDN